MRTDMYGTQACARRDIIVRANWQNPNWLEFSEKKLNMDLSEHNEGISHSNLSAKTSMTVVDA